MQLTLEQVEAIESSTEEQKIEFFKKSQLTVVEIVSRVSELNPHLKMGWATFWIADLVSLFGAFYHSPTALLEMFENLEDTSAENVAEIVLNGILTRNLIAITPESQDFCPSTGWDEESAKKVWEAYAPTVEAMSDLEKLQVQLDFVKQSISEPSAEELLIENIKSLLS